VEYFNCLVSLITNDTRFKREIKSRIAMAKLAFNRKGTVFTSKLDLYLRSKLVKRHIWSIVSHGADCWTFREIEIPEIPKKLRNLVLEKDGEYNLVRSCEIWRCIT